eukprot:Em0012g616a
MARLRKVKRSELPAEHKLSGKPSHLARPDMKAKFLEFVDASRAPNGRRVGSSSPEYYYLCFEASVRTIRRTKHETKERPKTAICPPKSDYCDLCKEYNEEVSRTQTTANRMVESGNADATALQQQKDLGESYMQLLASHKATAQECIDEYKRHRQQCQSDWQRIQELMAVEKPSQSDIQELGKLVPHCGYSAQPAASYYKQKLCFDNFGIVFHGRPSNFFYVYHEGAAGSKSADTMITYLDPFICANVPAWVKHVAIILDNAMVIKNQFFVGWMGQLVHTQFQTCCLLLMIHGHIKFSPDEAFARISHSFYCQDIFTGKELSCITAQYGLTYELNGSTIFCWKEQLSCVYKVVPHIKDLHDFVWQQVADDQPRLQVRQLCNEGQYNFVNVYCAADGVVPDVRPLFRSYEDAGECPPVNTEKMAHLNEIYDRWISPDRRLDILPPFVARPALALPALQPQQTAALAVAHHQQCTR